MNSIRRNRLEAIMKKIEDLKLGVEEVGRELEAIWDEEDEDIENTPKNLRASEHYYRAKEALICLEDASEVLDTHEMAAALVKAMDYITKAIEA